MITVYDLPSSFEDPNPTYTPFVRRIKFVLQHKGIPFTTHWVEYNDIATEAKKIGAPPTSINSDGTPQYTVPLIFDSQTNTAVADSFLIVKYLDRTYPNSGATMLPEGTEILQHLFASETAMMPLAPLYNFLRAGVYRKLNPSMQATYVARGFDPHQKFGKEELEKMWTQMEAGLGKIDAAMGSEQNGILNRNEPSFADAALGANLHIVKLVVGADSKEWDAISSTWHHGRWGKYLDWLQSYKPSPA